MQNRLTVRVWWLRFGLLVAGIGFICTANFSQTAEPFDTAYLAYSPDGRYLAVGRQDQVDILDAGTLQVVNIFTDLDTQWTEPIWSPDGQKIAFGNGADLEVWSQPTGIPVLEAVFPWEDGGFGAVTASAWSPNGEIIAVSCGGAVTFWNTNTNTLFQKFEDNAEAGQVWDLAWATDSASIAVARGDMHAEVWQVSTKTRIRDFYLEPYLDRQGFYQNPVVWDVEWSPSQQQLALAATNGIWIIDLTRIKNQPQNHLPENPAVTLITGHQNEVFSITWHPDGQRLASSSQDGTVRVWDMAGGKQLDLMQLGSDIFVKSVTWSPDGKFLAYGNVPESDALVVIQTDTN